jgi:hypothetical protein
VKKDGADAALDGAQAEAVALHLCVCLLQQGAATTTEAAAAGAQQERLRTGLTMSTTDSS